MAGTGGFMRKITDNDSSIFLATLCWPGRVPMRGKGDYRHKLEIYFQTFYASMFYMSPRSYWSLGLDR